MPVIKKAIRDKVPLFLISGSLTGLPAFTEWTDFTERFLPGKYESDYLAIRAGAIYLERDASQLNEVINGIKKIFEKVNGYEKRIAAVEKKFNSDEWNETLKRIRTKF